MAKSADWDAAEPSRPIRPKPIGRRNKKLVYYINWPIGEALYPKLSYIYIYIPTDDL